MPRSPEAETAIPRGRSANPSSWSARLPVAGLALGGCAISVYLALFQYHVLNTVWDPVFHDGSRKVLTSAVSRALPVSDATLGAGAYLVEALVEVCGGRHRWRDRPWLVLLLGLIAAGLALVGVALLITQPVLTGTFCTLCVGSAAISFTVAFLVRHEVVAGVQHVQQQRRQGQPLWSAIKGSR